MARSMTQMEAKAMVAAFRVSELQMFLGFVGMNRLGRKDDLVARAYQAIESRNFNDRIKSKIRELYDVVNAAGPVPSQPMVNGIGRGSMGSGMMVTMNYQPNVGQLRQSSLGASALQLRQERQGVPMPQLPTVSPSQVSMTELPFFEILDVVNGPTMLQPTNPSIKIQETRLQFVLKPEQVNQITHVRDIRPGASLDYPVQLQLRLCVANAPAPQPDAFPGSFNVKLNAKLVSLPPPIPSNRQGVEPKRPPKPVNITTQAKFSPVVANYLDISWGHEVNKVYAFQICLVRKLQPEELLKIVKGRPPISKEVTKARIREILAEDSDIATESLRLSLRCPLGKMRMTLPCRAYPTCKDHVQCFDATMFLHMNEKKASWVCPVCNKTASFKELAIDEYFKDMLGSAKSRDCDEVELDVDGGFAPIVVDEEGKKEVKRGKPEEVKAEAPVPVVKPERPPPRTNGEASSANTSAADAGRESPPLVTLSDDENDENANPEVAPPPPPAQQPEIPLPPPAPEEPHGSPEVLTIDDD